MTSVFKKTSHPVRDFLFFLLIIVFSIAVRHPLFSASSLIFALFYNGVLKNWKAFKILAGLMPFFVVLSCLNPIVSHWGDTVLFSICGKPFTKEAFFYGLNMGLTFVVMIQWFMAAGCVLTVEKFTYLFSPLFPAISLMMSMILRTIPLVFKRAKEIRQARQALGIKRDIKEVNAVFASTLEDGVFTARTMEDRGFKNGKRTSFLKYSFGFWDFTMVLLGIALCAFVIYGIHQEFFAVEFYPVIKAEKFWENTKETGVFAAFCLFALLPSVECLIRK